MGTVITMLIRLIRVTHIISHKARHAIWVNIFFVTLKYFLFLFCSAELVLSDQNTRLRVVDSLSHSGGHCIGQVTGCKVEMLTSI